MTLCAISLGGNLGDVPASFDWACRQLANHPDISSFNASRRYRTAPMGSAAGDPFLNTAAAFETTLDVAQLLDVLQQIERDCGRERTVHWGPRTLDLDLLLYSEQVIDSPRLQVPHPALWYRRFVLDPLCELVADARHPMFNMTIRELRERLMTRPLPVCFLPSVGWAVPANHVHQLRLVGTAHPTDDAAIVFASLDDAVPCRNVVCLPHDRTAAAQNVKDVLTAALDEPVAAN